MPLQLAEVAMAEFSPFRWIVLEPLPELAARSDIFEPILYLEISLLDAWLKSDEKTQPGSATESGGEWRQ